MLVIDIVDAFPLALRFVEHSQTIEDLGILPSACLFELVLHELSEQAVLPEPGFVFIDRHQEKNGLMGKIEEMAPIVSRWTRT